MEFFTRLSHTFFVEKALLLARKDPHNKIILLVNTHSYIIMVRGPKKHLKRLNAPKSWMLDKLTGVFAPKPAPGTSLLLFLDFFLLRVKWK